MLDLKNSKIPVFMFCFALVIILKICIQDMCGFGKVCVFELVINFGNWYMTRIAQYYVFLTSICFLYKDVPYGK